MIPVSEVNGTTPEQIEAAKEAARQKSRDWRAAPGNAEREAATKAAFKRDHPEKWREQKAAAHLRNYEKHGQASRDKQNAKRARLRAQVIEAYGGRCACPGCHVHHAELLTVDHVIGGNGNYRKNRRSTRDTYALIVKAGFPADFQLLCGSCNLAKGDREKCPLAGNDH